MTFLKSDLKLRVNWGKMNMKDYLLMSSNSILNVIRWSPKIHFLPSILIFPVNICNYDCIMCDCARSNNKAAKISMDFSMMTKLLEDLSALPYMPIVHFSGHGEPFVYPEIRKVMYLCRQLKLKYSITTNGYLLDRNVEDLVETRCHGLNVSLHGTAEYHDRVSKIPGSFEKTIKGLRNLAKKREKQQTRSPLVSINCVINNENVLYLKEIVHFFENLPIDSVVFQHLAFQREHLQRGDDFLILEKEKLLSLIHI
mgnify:CR=1 FL=1